MNQHKSEQNPNSPECNFSKTENEIWENKRKRINEKRRERRQRQKEQDPDFLKKEAAKTREQRQKQKDQNPDYTKIESAKRKALRQKRDVESLKQHLLFNHRKMFNDFFDSNFEENKDTISISKNEWEKLKKSEIDHEIKIGGTIKELHEYRQKQIDFLQRNLDIPCAASILFYIKTFVHRPKDQRKLTDEEKDWVKSLVLDKNDEREAQYNYYETKKEYYKEKQKASYEKTKQNRKTDNLNIRFMKADPNKVLSIDDITNNPFVSNFPIREQYKIDVWKTDKNPEYLEKWRREREDYEKEVRELSIEYKENFLKINGGSNSCRDI